MDSWRVPGNESSGSSGHRPVPRRVRKPVVVVPSPVESGSGVSEKKRQWKMVSPELPSVLDDINSVEQLCQTLADPDAAPVVFALIPSQTSGQTNGLEPHVLQVPLEMIVTIVFIYLNTCKLFRFLYSGKLKQKS